MILISEIYSTKLKNNNFILKEFLDNAFNLKSHLMEFLSIKECDLDGFLANAKMNLANSHPGDSLHDLSLIHISEPTRPY